MLRVAGYCRVSTEKEDQRNSFASQQRYFQEYISRNPEWELSAIYADEGVTGTSTKKRIQFTQMINDAYHRHFQLIITKEVSRFSRNLLDTIAYTRELKALGIGVIFLTDGFCTLDPDAELRLSIMGSLAQEESRKTSSRIKWGQTRQMERGVVFGTSMLGYDLSDGMLTVNPEGAEIVRLIFHKYGVEKKGTTTIARELQESGFRTLTGSTCWSESSILKILKNEKYVGDLLQKKSITSDYLTHIRKPNHGEEDMIPIPNHHEAIISRDLWEFVQHEIASRKRIRSQSAPHSSQYLFSGKIICAECGSRFVSRCKTRKDGSSYRRWGCYTAARYGRKAADNAGCNVGKQIRDDLLLEILTHAIRSLRIDRSTITEEVTSLIIKVKKTAQNASQSPTQLKNQIQTIQRKQIRAIDSFLNGIISQKELEQTRSYYNSALDSLECRLAKFEQASEYTGDSFSASIKEVCDSILTCKTTQESFLRMMLQYMRIHADGRVEVKLSHSSFIRTYLLKPNSATDI